MGKPPNPAKYTDAEAKEILLNTWRDKTKLWNGPNENRRWLRAQPVNDGAVGPRLLSPGAQLFHIQPDGMWARLFGTNAEPFADVIAVEVCGTIQNFNDKRARYMSSTAALMLKCDKDWLLRGPASNHNWREAGLAKKPVGAISFAVRHIRVLYALPGEIYERWRDHGVLAGHEFMCLHSSLQTYTSQPVQEFLKLMAPSSHYYIQT
ncbi:hypothetical protein [Rhodopila sp.]|uniref:hypothetical protein n=1 Tax=Rhodopila sp. TaxID=2480087 RepID=UPI003D105255